MMKKILFFSAMALCLFAGCSEDENEPSGDYIDPNASIVGVWELIRGEYYENGQIVKDETAYYDPMECYMVLRDDLTMRFYDWPPDYWDGTYTYDRNTHIINMISDTSEDPLLYYIETVVHLTDTELKIKMVEYWTATDLPTGTHQMEVYRRTTLPD